MSLQIEILPRRFKFEEQELPDPSPDMKVKQVIDFYSAQFPELNNASIVGPEIKDGKQEFTFKTVLGDKG